jgi:hypothetical protein
MLFKDEQTELCRAHIVNQVFPGADPTWTVQRADVDSFFGHVFEAEFVLLKEHRIHDVADVLINASLSRKLGAVVRRDGEPIDVYRPVGAVPPHHTELFVERAHQPAGRLALKVAPTDMLASLSSDWKVTLDRDISLAAIVSLLKAAHLTMFSMVGYDYALSSTGWEVGHHILGAFFVANCDKSQAEARLAAMSHFRPYLNLVRPARTLPAFFGGTVTDHRLLLCMAGEEVWAFLVIVRAGVDSHAVLLPVLESAEGAARYVTHLEQSGGTLMARLCQYTDGTWATDTKTRLIEWPATSLLGGST